MSKSRVSTWKEELLRWLGCLVHSIRYGIEMLFYVPIWIAINVKTCFAMDARPLEISYEDEHLDVHSSFDKHREPFHHHRRRAWIFSQNREREGEYAHHIHTQRPESDLHPVVVFIHGGAWSMGRKEQYGFVGRFLQECGYVAVVPSYRLAPEVDVRGMLFDVDQCMRWTVREIHRYGGDPRRIAVIGHSSGAHLAVLLCLLRICEQCSAPPESASLQQLLSIMRECHLPSLCDAESWISRVRLVCGINGVYNIASHYEHEQSRYIDKLSHMYDAMLGPSRFNDFSPTHWVQQQSFVANAKVDEPRFLLLHAGWDKIVPSRSSGLLARLLGQWTGRQSSNSTTYLRFEGSSHGSVLWELVYWALFSFRRKKNQCSGCRPDPGPEWREILSSLDQVFQCDFS